MAPEEALIKQLERKVVDGEKLIETVSKINNVSGVQKLQKKIKQEVCFLLKVAKSKEPKKEHLLCTNLHHFQALVSCLIASCDAMAILQVFALTKADGNSRRICVDIVAKKGQQWIKVIARNPKALSQLSMGEGEFGQRSVVDHAVEYLECAQQHPHLFRTPEVVFHFSCGIEKALADRLALLGVAVSGKRLDMCDLPLQEAESDSRVLQTCVSNSCVEVSVPGSVSDSSHGDEKLNLDVTAMLAYVSALTNGGCCSQFKEPILNQQAEWERARPVKPVLDRLFEGKSLFCCASAMKDFKSIVSTLGGPGEVSRTNELLARVTVVPSMVSPCTERQLKIGGKIKQRSLAVFSTGDALRAVTVSANEGFVRAAKCQGVEFAVFIHESRALTEGKELGAKGEVHGSKVEQLDAEADIS